MQCKLELALLVNDVCVFPPSLSITSALSHFHYQEQLEREQEIATALRYVCICMSVLKVQI